MGRPSKYEPEYAEEAHDICLLMGATDAELADYFEVSEDTINEWKKVHPEFSESLKKGKQKADGKVARTLYDKALAGDTTAMIFWLKNRHSAKWRDGGSVKGTLGEGENKIPVSLEVDL